MSNKRGFTLIEILVVIGIIAILATITISAINPSKQFKQARDTERMAHVAAILDALHQNMIDNGGLIQCGANTPSLPTNPTNISSTGGIDLYSCIVPEYLPNIPYDPNAMGSGYTSSANYSTNYSINTDSSGRITISAVAESRTTPISVSR